MLAAIASISAPAMGSGVQFTIRDYRVEGATLVTADRIAGTLERFRGEGKTFDTLRQAVESLEAVYEEAGYGAVRVQLPEQDIDDGIVRLRVVEARLGRVVIEGNEHFSNANIRASVPALREGDPPRLGEAGASLALANESFAKRTRLTLQRGDNDGTVDAVLRVVDEPPWRMAIGLDNTGTSTTGRQRLGFIYQHANLWDRDHAFSAQYITSPEHEEKVAIVGLGYRIPIYAWGDSFEAAYGNSNVDSGNVRTVGGDYAIAGRGEFATLRYNLGLPRVGGGIEQRIGATQDWRYYESHVVPSGGTASLVPNLSAAPFGLTYALSSPEGALNWRASLSYVENLPSRYGTDRDYNQPGARPGARSRFTLWRWSVGGSAALPGGINVRAEANGQLTRDLLISGEQFGIGGMDSLRGYGEREISNDQGYRGNVELASAPFKFPGDDNDHRLSLLAFHDFGYVSRNQPLPGETREERPSSFGVGFRFYGGRSFQLRTDVATVTQTAGTKRKDDVMAHVQMLVIF